MSEPFNLDGWLTAQRARVDAMLTSRLAAPAGADDPGRLVEAMRYSLLAPGKRLRPLLALAAAEALGAQSSDLNDDPLVTTAAAVELVHCYSLIHDDLPAMDDDDFRRGRPSSHKTFGEATAILAGDALLTLAFEWVAVAGATAMAEASGTTRWLKAIAALARAAGWQGMVRGQARDLGEAPPPTVSDLERLHAEKTGALFSAATEIGGLYAGADETQRASLARFGVCYGIAFQHADDGDDAEHVRLAPRTQGRKQALVEQAMEAVAIFDSRAGALRALARALVQS